MVNPIPDNVKETLAGLTPAQQVVIRGYVACLRDEIKEYEGRVKALLDEPDPHAHYHGHEKCTSDHGHGPDHGEESKEEPHGGHEHRHDHSKHEEEEGHDHKHGHHDDEPEHHDHGSHDHEHKHHGHDHDHKKEKEDMPAWKKKALESGSSDPTTAPFGGSWNAETSVSATTDQQKE